MKRILPWLIAAALAVILAIVLVADRRKPNEVNGVTQDNSGRVVVAWIDPMFSQGPPHLYKSNHPGVAPDCQMKLVPQYADEASGGRPAAVAGYANISLPSAKQQLIGVKLGKAEVRDLSRSTRTVGRVAIDERRLAQIHAKFEGFAERLYVSFTGQPVRRGQPLLSIYSPELLATENELILAARNRQQFGGQLYDAARRRLLLWDMTPADVDRIANTGRPIRSVTFRSPFDGVVLAKNVIEGARVMPADTLYEIADLSSVWVLADVYQSELPYVRVGQTAQISIASMTGRSWTGRITFVSPTLDEKTRTVKVRIELENPDGILKPDMFADVLLAQPIGPVLSIPESAVLQTGTRSIVFVTGGNGVFEPREVVTGTRAGGFFEIRAGLQAGETVAIDANFLIDSESRLKAGLENQKADGGVQK